MEENVRWIDFEVGRGAFGQFRFRKVFKNKDTISDIRGGS
jgi:hypothetical protein